MTNRASFLQALPALRTIAFVVTAEDKNAIEEAVAGVASRLKGANRRGRALADIARADFAAEEASPG